LLSAMISQRAAIQPQLSFPGYHIHHSPRTRAIGVCGKKKTLFQTSHKFPAYGEQAPLQRTGLLNDNLGFYSATNQILSAVIAMHCPERAVKKPASPVRQAICQLSAMISQTADRSRLGDQGLWRFDDFYGDFKSTISNRKTVKKSSIAPGLNPALWFKPVAMEGNDLLNGFNHFQQPASPPSFSSSVPAFRAPGLRPLRGWFSSARASRPTGWGIP
jgi:hypothetical protein